MRLFLSTILFFFTALAEVCFAQGKEGVLLVPTESPGKNARAKTEYMEMAEALKLEIRESERMIDRARLKIAQAKEELQEGIRTKSLTEEEISHKKKKINTAERKLKVLETRLQHARQVSGEI